MTLGNNFLSRMQLVMIDLLQGILTRRSLSTAYRILYAVDKELRVKTSCSRSIATSCVLFKKLLPMISATMSLYSIIDDTCCAIETNLIEDFHRHLNFIKPSIQFMLETESEGQFAFLDILITCNSDKSIDMTIYRKPTHTNKYLDFSSHHLFADKIAVVRTLHSRAQALTSSAVSRTQEELTISQVLTLNGYLSKFIQRHSHHQCLLHPKDPVPKEERSGLIYGIPSTNCSWTYIGQTSRTLAQQIKLTSVLAKHSHSTGHPIKRDQAHIINSCPTPQDDALSPWPSTRSHLLNREQGKLPHIYKTLIRHS